ncbi:zinc ribbon domain-containing protein [Desulfosporosinus sp. PR]|uniref:zinc ribbon domain-containing protein n=1 Tax=Candidatus Desulfosporosinus nitrosoreducens TaxID=3401928 RepID=UPI0027F44FB5|nr:zinc ribbon domain-containing protein [Desulfosporosinus sp. PR]MDQ7094285.1 zinc ribbon domain-containing protein [Desulfosporosinus sp. PR]
MMVNCKACGKEIAKGVKKCPHCGKDQRNFFGRHKILTGIVALIVIIIIVSVSSGGGKSKATSAPATTPSATQSSPPASSSTPASTPAPAPEKKWTQIGSWSGSGIKNTEDFTISDGAQYRLNWEAQDNGGVFQIYVEDSKGAPVDVAANVQNAAKDVSYVHASAGTYHLSINSANTKWSVTLEEQK